MLYREVIEGIFSIGLFINALSFIPQIVRLIKERSSKDLSFVTFFIFFITQLSAVLYGFIIQNKIIIVGYILSMVTCGPVVFLIAYFRKKSYGYSEDSTNIKGIDFKDIIQQAPVHIYWKDLEGKCLGCSDLQLKSLGIHSLKDYIGKDDYDLFSAQNATKLVVTDKTVIKIGELRIAEEFSDDNKLLYMSYKIPLRDKNNKIVGLLDVSMNITEARHKEMVRKEFLENIIALMPGHIYWIDRAGVYQGCNDEQAKSAGLKSRAEIVGKRNSDLPWNSNSNFIPELVDKTNNEVMLSGEPIVIEEPAILNDGTEVTFLSSKVPLKNNEGEVIGLLGISFDITDRKKMEKELLEAKSK